VKRIQHTAILALSVAAALSAADAGQIMQSAFERTLSRPLRYEGSLVRFHPKGHEHRRSRWKVERTGPPGEGRIKVRYLAPEEVAGVTLLVHCERGQPARQWLYTPATDRARLVRPVVRGKRFYSTDFTFDDLQEADASSSPYRLAGEESVSGEVCWRIEARPAETSPYDRKVFWVDQKRNLIMQADHFIGSNHVKRLTYRDYEEDRGVWIPAQVELRDVYTGWRTVLSIENAEVGVEFDEAAFEVESLGSP
jgi:hypothetical protein